MFPEWHHAVPESAYFKVPETLKIFRMYSTSRYAPCSTRLYTEIVDGAHSLAITLKSVLQVCRWVMCAQTLSGPANGLNSQLPFSRPHVNPMEQLPNQLPQKLPILKRPLHGTL